MQKSVSWGFRAGVVAAYAGPMTWVRRRSKTLAWTVLVGIVLLVGQAVWRYTEGGVPLDQDLLGLALRVAALGLLVGIYLTAGGSTSASPAGLTVHDGIRRTEVTPALLTKVEEDKTRGVVVASLADGRRLVLPGVPPAELREVRRHLRGR